MAGLAAVGGQQATAQSVLDPELQPLLDRSHRRCEVVIVGAGLSGLRTAQLLQAAHLEVLVLEAQRRVGGRTLTIDPEGTLPGTFIDEGGQWVSPGQTSLRALAKELNVSLFDTWHEGNIVDWHDGERSTYTGLYPAYWTEQDKSDTEAAVSQLKDMANTFDLEAPWRAEHASQWDEQTLDDWLAANVRSALARIMVKRGIVGVFGSGPGELSLLAALFVLRSAQDLIRHFQPSGVDQRLVGGAQQLCIKMAERLGPRVIRGAWVSQVHHGPEGVLVMADKLSVRAQRAVITLPPTLAGRLRYVPALPAARDHLTESTPMGWVIKVHCVYPIRFWREQNLSGAVTSDEGAIRATADNSPPSGAPGILIGFIEGAAARDLAPKTVEERRTVVLKDLVRYFGDQAANPTAYYEHSWGDDEFSRGAYGGYWTPGLWTAYGPVLRAPVDTLHWAGTETSANWNGKMEGALLSAERVAAEVVAALRGSAG
jgi:monoamine oxidase